MTSDNRRLCRITIEDAQNVKRNTVVEREINAAIADIVAHNVFDPIAIMEDGPYDLTIRLDGGQLYMDVAGQDGREYGMITLSLKPMHRMVRDYFLICESHMTAASGGSAMQIETLDMARRGLHDEGSVELANLLHDKVSMDFPTARRLFTLVCALHLGTRNEAMAAGA